MAYKSVLSKEAVREYEHIITYLDEILLSVSAVRSFIQEFDNQISIICENPKIYSYSKIKELASLGYRTVLINNYLALYKINETEKLIEIAHIFHQSQDYAVLV